MGYVLVDNWTARECPCLERERLKERFRNSRIPVELEQAHFQNYRVENEAQRTLYQAAKQYVQHFLEGDSVTSLGFLATVGEQTLRQISDGAKRRRMRARHNNMGVGKSHLQMAIAKAFIQQGIAVLVISDVVFMDELMQQKASSAPAFHEQINQVADIPVLVWDDLGKSNSSEAKKSAYFRIIDERYRNKKPILFSSNEDTETLEDRIGDAAASRLLGMSRIYTVEGPDYRIVGQK
jgi:DNA replication protein DnaC